LRSGLQGSRVQQEEEVCLVFHLIFTRHHALNRRCERCGSALNKCRRRPRKLKLLQLL
jgi:uncharacterized paraquat-inducible protein A